MESGIDGEIVTLTNKTVYVFDEDGNLNYSCGADADEIFLDLQKCSDGKIYLRGTSATGVGFVRRLDTSKHTLGISFENVSPFTTKRLFIPMILMQIKRQSCLIGTTLNLKGVKCMPSVHLGREYIQ